MQRFLSSIGLRRTTRKQHGSCLMRLDADRSSRPYASLGSLCKAFRSTATPPWPCL